MCPQARVAAEVGLRWGWRLGVSGLALRHLQAPLGLQRQSAGGVRRGRGLSPSRAGRARAAAPGAPAASRAIRQNGGAARAPGGCWKCQGGGTSRGCCAGKDGTSKGNGEGKASCGRCHMGGGQFPSRRDIERDDTEGDRERDQAHSVLYSRMQACTPGLRGGPQRRQRWSPPSSPSSFSALSGYRCP